MTEPRPRPHRSWARKFADAFRGVAEGMRDQRSFWVHLPAAIAVLVAGVLLRVSAIEWCLLTVCIASVIAAELFNSALEHLARAVDRNENEHLRRALDIASGAVLAASMGAVVVGAIIFLPRLVELLR